MLTALVPSLPLIAQAADDAPIDDEFNPALGLFVLAMFAAFVLVILAGVALMGGIAGAAFATAILIALFAIVAAMAVIAVVHFTLALIIWTRRPRTRVWMHKRWWGMLALPLGPLAAMPFFVLHYRPGARPRCYACGYDRAGVHPASRCPECGTPSVEPVGRLVPPPAKGLAPDFMAIAR